MKKDTNKDFFAQKAKGYDQEVSTTDNVSKIAELMLNEVSFTKDMNIMDFGSGTGLLLTKIAPFVGKITAVDVSKAMTDILKTKKSTINCNLDILEIDLIEEDIDEKFDSIISSMTIHHIEDVPNLLTKLYKHLKVGGAIAISDLDLEDGTFHTEDTGVFHFGFDRDKFLKMAENAGFQKLKIQTVGSIKKPHGEYSVFLLTGNR